MSWNPSFLKFANSRDIVCHFGKSWVFFWDLKLFRTSALLERWFDFKKIWFLARSHPRSKKPPFSQIQYLKWRAHNPCLYKAETLHSLSLYSLCPLSSCTSQTQQHLSAVHGTPAFFAILHQTTANLHLLASSTPSYCSPSHQPSWSLDLTRGSLQLVCFSRSDHLEVGFSSPFHWFTVGSSKDLQILSCVVFPHLLRDFGSILVYFCCRFWRFRGRELQQVLRVIWELKEAKASVNFEFHSHAC